MKKSISILLLVFSFIISQAEIIEKTYKFRSHQIVQVGDHQVILFENTLLSGHVGEPSLPYCAVQLLLPPGHIASKVEFLGKGLTTLDGQYHLYPQQSSRPLSESGSGVFQLNEGIYNSLANYPDEQTGKFATNFMNGYAILSSTFTPVNYIPGTGELSYYKEVTIRITTRESMDADLALENGNGQPGIKEKVQRFVQNPVLVNNYKFDNAKTGNYDILIISTAAFESDFEDLQDLYLIRGYESQFASREDISTTITGQDDQEKIRNYIIQEYQAHNVAYVILGGDAELVPYRGFYCAAQSSTLYEDDNIPADLYYSALDGTWNDDGDNLWGEIGEDDLLPDIAVARLPFSDLTELNKMLHKTMNYQDNPVLGQMDHVLMAGEHLYNDPLTWGADYLDLLIGERSDNGYTTIGIPATDSIYELYDRDASWGQGDIIARINDGRSFVHHSGHSNANYTMRLYMSDITNSNFSQLNGVDQNYTLIYTHGCICGAFDESDCIAEKMLYIDNFVVAGGFNSRYGWFNEGQTEGPSAHLHREFTDALYHEKIDRIGATHMESKIQTSTWVNAPGQHEEGALRWCFYDCNILGDAAMAIWTAEPIPLEAAYPQSITLGTDSIEVTITSNGTPVENFRCTFFKDGVYYGVGITDSLGDAIIMFDPQITSVGDAELIVSGYNCLPVTFNTVIVPSGSPWIVYNDHDMEEITGNGNGLPDYGEYAFLNLLMENVGDLDADNVIVTIRTENEFFTIEDSTELYGSIASGTTKYISDAFTFNVADNAPDQEMVELIVDADDGSKQLWSSGFQMTLLAPVLEIGNIVVKDTIEGNSNGFLDPGETAIIRINSLNTGHSDCQDAIGILSSNNAEIQITDTLFNIGSLPYDASIEAEFIVTVDEEVSIGTALNFDYLLKNGHYSAEESFVLMVGLVVEDFETAGFNSFGWEFSGSLPWTICEDDPFEGSYCMKSGAIGSSTTSVISINIDVLNAGELSFYKKVSSEEDYDFLKFKIDNNVVGSWSGEVDWSPETYAVTAGNHTFSWIYEKDIYMTGGEDCAWVDYIVFPPHSSSVGVSDGRDVSFRSSVFPNPFNGQVTFQLGLASSSSVNIDIFNAYGQHMEQTINNPELPEGHHIYQVNLQHLPAGLYFCIFRVNDEVYIHKVIHIE